LGKGIKSQRMVDVEDVDIIHIILQKSSVHIVASVKQKN